MILKSTRCTRRERREEIRLRHELMWAGFKSLRSSGHLCFCRLELPWDRQTNSYECTENHWWMLLSWVYSAMWRVNMAKRVYHPQRLRPSLPDHLRQRRYWWAVLFHCRPCHNKSNTDMSLCGRNTMLLCWTVRKEFSRFHWMFFSLLIHCWDTSNELYFTLLLVEMMSD